MSDKERVLETLRQELKHDRTKSNVLDITQLGLVEMTRKKMRHSLSNTLQSTGPYCHGDGRVLSGESVVLKVRKEMIRRFAEETHANYLIHVHPSVADLIYDHSGAQAPLLPQEKGRNIYVHPDKSLHVEQFEVVPIASKADLDHLTGEIRSYH